jgi:hypothetical protein
MLFMRSIARAVPLHLTDAVTKASELWVKGTLVVDGAPTPARDLPEEIRTLLEQFESLDQVQDKYLHDTLHVLSNMLRVLQRVLLHPPLPSDTLTLQFPRSETGLERLTAAERFFNKNDTEEDRDTLKRVFGNPIGLASVTRKLYTVYAFQSPEALHLLTPYRAETFSKSDMTIAEFKIMVNDILLK